LKYLITGDFQINERNRIQDYVKQLNVIEEKSREIEYDYYVNVGDIFERKKPSPFELKVFANHIYNVKAKNKVIIIGNHDELSNELTSLDWLPKDVKVVRTFQLEDKVNLYFAHRTVSEAKTGLEWSLNETSYKTLYKETKADVIVLGHIHSPQIINEINPLVFHPGSIERNTFGERNDKKYIWDLNIKSKTDIKLTKTKLDIKSMHYIIYNIDSKEIMVNDKKATTFNIKNSIVKVDIIGTKEKISKINYDKLLDKFSGSYKLDFNFIYSDDKEEEFKMDENVKVKSDIELLEDYAEAKEINNKLLKYGKKIINEFN